MLILRLEIERQKIEGNAEILREEICHRHILSENDNSFLQNLLNLLENFLAFLKTEEQSYDIDDFCIERVFNLHDQNKVNWNLAVIFHNLIDKMKRTENDKSVCAKLRFKIYERPKGAPNTQATNVLLFSSDSVQLQSEHFEIWKEKKVLNTKLLQLTESMLKKLRENIVDLCPDEQRWQQYKRSSNLLEKLSDKSTRKDLSDEDQLNAQEVKSLTLLHQHKLFQTFVTKNGNHINLY